MENKQQDFNLNGTNLVQLVWQRKFVVIAIAIVAFITSLIISFQITPLFQSTAILIPGRTTQASKDIFVPTRAYGLTVFGEDEEVEQLLQVLSSETLRRETIAKQNLFAHYGINPTEKEAWFKVNTSFSNHISFRRSRYRTVRIEVLDYSPKKAAEIANNIVVIADSLMRETKRVVAQKALEVASKQYEEALSEYYKLSDSMSYVMSQGVLDMPNQAKELTKVYAEAIAAGNNKSASNLKGYMNQLAQYGGDFTRYIFEIENKAKQIVFMQESLHFLKLESEGAISSQFVIDWAFESDKKAKPKKAVIVIASTLSATFFAIFLLVLIGFIRTSLYPKSVGKN
ncbi:MAG: hypothetical protein CVT98_01750 [Bacteroidetes bacterium HGW-Bacteroidetes-15]|nr:MAG: hypothetical protein CVT98_01750 [Bacteroidetes bacterium HGW-Bacteroidetes-15]